MLLFIIFGQHFFLSSPIEPAQKLYVRLFGRKWKWLTQQQIKYPRIKEDLDDVFTELKEKGFLMSGKSSHSYNTENKHADRYDLIDLLCIYFLQEEFFL